MASVPDNPSVVSVTSTVNIKTVVGHQSDGLSARSEPSQFLSSFSSEWSSVGISWLMASLSILVRDNLFSVSPHSNGLGSPVEDPPLSAIPWCIVSDSELVSPPVASLFSSVEWSSSRHSCSDLESSSISEWISWEVYSSGINGPFLGFVLLVPPPDNRVVLS